MRKKCLLEKWWSLERICNKSYWNLFGPVTAAVWPWSAKPSLGLINTGSSWFWESLADEGYQDPREGSWGKSHVFALLQHQREMLDTWCFSWTAQKGFEFVTAFYWYLVPAVGSSCWFAVCLLSWVDHTSYRLPYCKSGLLERDRLKNFAVVKCLRENTSDGNWGFVAKG